MAEQEVNIQSTIYGLNSFNNVIDTKFSQLAKSVDVNETDDNVPGDLIQFFDDYNSLFYDIPKEGDTDSHEYIVYRSMEYLGVSLQDMQDEITFLRQENTELKNQILQSSALTPGDIEGL
jgi:hypothetical protein